MKRHEETLRNKETKSKKQRDRVIKRHETWRHRQTNMRHEET